MKQSGRPGLVDKVLSEVIPMKARMIHGKKISGELYEQSQEYDIHGRVCFCTYSIALTNIPSGNICH